MRGPLPLLALLAALLACSAPATARDACGFTTQQPRYQQGRTTLTALNVSPQGALFLNDALLRALTAQLGLQPCQVLLMQGEACDAALAAACPDPSWLCGGNLLLANSVYQAAKGGLCTNASGDPACRTLRGNLAIAQAVAGGCEATCVAQLAANGSGADASAPPSPPPPPAQPAQAASSTCYAFTLQVDSPTVSAAQTVAANLHNATTAGALLDSLASFSAPGQRIAFILGSTDVSPAVGFGYFPPPRPPPSPPPPSPPPPSPPPPFPPPPPSPPPPLTPFEPSGNGSDSAPGFDIQSADDSAELQYGPWSGCSADCGAGWQTRTATCASADGTLLPLAQCAGAAAADVDRPCEGPACTAPYWQYSPWSQCNATCGGGAASRTAACVAPRGFKCAAANQLPTQQECNTAPCGVHAWQAGGWGECSASCGGGNQSRPVTCIDPSGRAVAASACDAAPPAAQQRCNLQPCDFCSGNSCFGAGTCSGGACVCSPGLNLTGAYCQIPRDCESGVVDAELECCPSGLLDASGTCCSEGAALDGTGACCEQGWLDACGVCGAAATAVDVQGSCCATVLDANGVCCTSGHVDECGVCDGMGNSCAITLQLQINVSPGLVYGDSVEEAPLEAFLANLTDSLGLPPGSLSLDSLQQATPADAALAIASDDGASGKRLLLAERAVGAGSGAPDVSKSTPAAEQPITLTATITLEPNSSSLEPGGMPFSAAWMAAVLAAAAAQQAPSDAVQLGGAQAGRVGVCGNGVCELEERSVEGALNGTCPQDCGFGTKVCPGGCGGGTCLPATGTCSCFVGYDGAACGGCASGYNQVNGTCVADVVALGLALSTPPAPAPAALTEDSGSSQGGSSINVGAIVGPIVAVAALAALAGAFLLFRRRRRAFRAFSANLSPTVSGAQPCCGDLESGSSGSEQRSLRERYGSVSSAGAHSSQPAASASRGASAGGGAAESGASGLRGSQDALRSSQERFKHYNNALARGDAMRQSTGTFQGQPQGSAATAPLRRSLTALSPAAGAAAPLAAGAVAATLWRSYSDGAGLGSPAVPTAEVSHTAEDSPAPHSAAATSMAVHPMASLRAPMSQLSLPHSTAAARQAGRPQHGLLAASEAGSPGDPQARLFNNPAFNAEDVTRMSDSQSVLSASHVPRPGYVMRDLSARPRMEAAAAAAAEGAALRRALDVSRSLDSSQDTGVRRGKLEALRAAVEALEADAAEGRLGARNPAAPGELASPSGTQPFNPRASLESVCWVGKDEGSNASPLTLSDGQRRFPDGRPGVPKLQLGMLLPEEEGESEDGSEVEEEDEEEEEVEEAPAAQTARPRVPGLALSALNPAGRVVSQPGRIPAANFSALDASLRRSPSKLQHSASAHLPSQASGSVAAGDPLDDLDVMLGDAQQPSHAGRAREGGLAAGIHKLLAPLRSARRPPADVDWQRQLSARGRLTPQSWAEDSGMQRTRAQSSLQRSLELDDASLAAHSGDGGGTPASGTSGGASRYFNTPRGRLLQTLAAEAAAAHPGRAAGAPAAQPQPSYSQVIGGVDAALQATGGSPSKIPRQPSARAGADGMIRAVHGSSPSRIPRLPGLGGPPAARDDGGGLLASPAKGRPGGWLGGALTSSMESLRGAMHRQ